MQRERKEKTVIHKCSVNKIKSAVKTSELQTALNSNGHITDKNLIIRVAFFDRGVIGQLKLKAEHELTPEKYIEEWQKTVINKSGILFLFVKDKVVSQYALHKMVPSYQLEDEHLFPLVTEFINEHLSGNFITIIGNGTKYLANAITPVWDKDNNKRKEAVTLAKQDRYKRFHFNFLHGYLAGYRMSDLRDLNSLPKVYLSESTSQVWFKLKGSTDTIKPTIPIYIISRDFKTTEIEITDNFGNTIETFIVSFLGLQNNTKTVLIEMGSDAYNLIEFIDNKQLFSQIQDVSHWDWGTNCSDDYKLASKAGVSDYQVGNKYWYYIVDSKAIFNDGDIKPPWIGGYWSTYCNFFASDLSRKVLFPGIFNKNDIMAGTNDYAPWGKIDCANELYREISTNDNFKKIESTNPVDEWEFTKKGFVVYYIKSEDNKNCSPSGHIATCYNGDDETVIQVGSHRITNPVGKWNDNNKEAYLYLGYILK